MVESNYKGELVFKGSGVSVWEDEKTSEDERGVCITM